jgi:hypothetical protein
MLQFQSLFGISKRIRVLTVASIPSMGLVGPLFVSLVLSLERMVELPPMQVAPPR